MRGEFGSRNAHHFGRRAVAQAERRSGPAENRPDAEDNAVGTLSLGLKRHAVLRVRPDELTWPPKRKEPDLKKDPA